MEIMIIMVLGQLPPRKIAPNPNSNPNANQGGQLSSGDTGNYINIE